MAGVGTTLSKMAPVGATYKVKIVDHNSTMSGMSKANFSITGTMTVTAPNGGEKWALGSTQNITWNSTGLTGADSVAIQLWKSGVKLGVITTVPAVPGSMPGQ